MTSSSFFFTVYPYGRQKHKVIDAKRFEAGVGIRIHIELEAGVGIQIRVSKYCRIRIQSEHQDLKSP